MSQKDFRCKEMGNEPRAREKDFDFTSESSSTDRQIAPLVGASAAMYCSVVELWDYLREFSENWWRLATRYESPKINFQNWSQFYLCMSKVRFFFKIASTHEKSSISWNSGDSDRKWPSRVDRFLFEFESEEIFGIFDLSLQETQGIIFTQSFYMISRVFVCN